MKISKSDKINRALATIFTDEERFSVLDRRLVELGWQRVSPVDIISPSGGDALDRGILAVYGHFAGRHCDMCDLIINDGPHSFPLLQRRIRTLVVCSPLGTIDHIYGRVVSRESKFQDQAVWIATCKLLYIAQYSITHRKVGGHYASN